MTRSMIFYYPFPIPDHLQFGESMRLVNMRRAFQTVGYEVETISGYAQERQAAIRRVQQATSDGRPFDFVYAEASTWPMVLHRRNIKHPFIDARFFRWARAHDIPVGLFYRDVYWRFMGTHVPWWFTKSKRIVSLPFYWYEWLVYRVTVSHLFLPSLAMTAALPSKWPRGRVTAAPPGAPTPALSAPCAPQKERIRLFYVGNVTPGRYDLEPLLRLVLECPQTELVLCCREQEWKAYRVHYAPYLSDRVRVVHASGEALASYYAEADLFALLWESDPYFSFAVPIKVFESLGYGLPIITLEGTEAARIIVQDDLGWVVANLEEARRCIGELSRQPELLVEKRRHVEAARAGHTWEARAQAVADTLATYRRRA